MTRLWWQSCSYPWLSCIQLSCQFVHVHIIKLIPLVCFITICRLHRNRSVSVSICMCIVDGFSTLYFTYVCLPWNSVNGHFDQNKSWHQAILRMLIFNKDLSFHSLFLMKLENVTFSIDPVQYTVILYGSCRKAKEWYRTSMTRSGSWLNINSALIFLYLWIQYSAYKCANIQFVFLTYIYMRILFHHASGSDHSYTCNVICNHAKLHLQVGICN